MRIRDIYLADTPAVSFELYPPKSDEAEQRLFLEDIPQLLALSPAFMTCTYGAGGSTRDKTLDVVRRIKQEHNKDTACHLTCVGSSKADIAAYLDRAAAAGIEHVVALRGDPPRGDHTFQPHPDGFRFAVELVRFIRQRGGFDIAVAGYPESHPECPDKHLDWQRCRDKVEAGADAVVTQLFYDNEHFLEFEDYLRNRLGVQVPIIPGILPILNAGQIRRFCDMCGATLPPDVQASLERYADDPESCRQYGIDLATRMCEALIAHGVPGLHFYVLNRVDSVTRIMRNLNLAPRRSMPRAVSTSLQPQPR